MRFPYYYLTLLLWLLTIQLINVKCSILQEEEVSRWTKELGNELWNLGKTITKVSEIQETYGFLNAQVEQKNPKELLTEIVQNIENMMDRKMDAIKSIQEEAEKQAYEHEETNETYYYHSSRYSQIEGEISDQPEALNQEMYLSMQFDFDTHFYNLSINTNYSSVHVPTNIYDKNTNASEAIKWSEALNEVFVQNYNSDPALSWQYFGSTTGIMRHYPAKKWKADGTDEFDCRIRTWFIEAATCRKDVVILVDNSGSMEGLGKHIAALTVYSILDTFSNNDYINVLNYSETINYTIPCFEDTLVQATPENVQFFKDAVEGLKPYGKTRLNQALAKALDLLGTHCNKNSSNCNQAIMIVTDGASKNLSDIIEKYNSLDGDSNSSVRIFSYLVGKEVTNVEEFLWMACANRGYYTHVQSVEQVTASVLKYINVIARPLVLQNNERPVSWTHAYTDITYDDDKDDQINEPYRLLTSVAIPAFDLKANENNETTVAKLLGVAGTDVPIDDIQRLTFPYKIGVNGYVFIVSNNGYVLMHPGLKPTFKGMITRNYNSIDLTEVEQLDNDLPPRENDPELDDLRLALVDGVEGSMHNISVKYHYDDMQRVTREKYDYYYAPLRNTPFSIAIALPNKYGNYSLDVGDEISKNRHTGENITNFFRGSNWKIHPKWVYCKYHYLEGHEYQTPEDELIHFLGKMYDYNFKWERQYESIEKESSDEDNSFRKYHEKHDYFCDRQLVQRLIFDAKNTFNAFQENLLNQSVEFQLIERYNATLRFVATMSGLTRWEYLSEEVENSTEMEFGHLHSKAIDETWYKSAVIQRQYDIESFVYSVPFQSSFGEDVFVTGSYAIFPSDASSEAPGSVVGFQFSYSKLKARVKKLSSVVSNQCPTCETCDSTLDCYIVDSSGYIIVSEFDSHVGRFFGEIEGDIMDSMLNETIFESVTVYEFQHVCLNNRSNAPSIAALATPFDYVYWFLTNIGLLIVRLNFCQFFGLSPYVSADDDDEDDEEEIKYTACDLERSLYILKQEMFLHDNYHGEISTKRNYYIKKIPYSNLIFVAINATKPKDDSITYSTAFQKIHYDDITDLPCRKLNLNALPRRKLKGCFNENPKEYEINDCGKGLSIQIDYGLLSLLMIFIISCTKYHILL